VGERYPRRVRSGARVGSGAEPADVAARFALDGPVEAVQAYQQGNINLTHVVTVSGPVRYLLQRLNPDVFPDPDLLMGNVSAVTAHLRARLEARGEEDVDRRVLTVVPARDGGNSVRGSDGAAWRCVRFIERTHSRAALDSEAQAAEAGRAYGELHRLLVDLDPGRLGQTILGFHDPERRLRALGGVLRRDPAGRARGAGQEIDFVLGHRHVARAGRRLGGSDVPTRVVHNDAKIENLLFDDDTDRAVCVTDLDTVMPGSVLWDVGDMVRSAACRAPEDEPDLDRVAIDVDLVRAVMTGFRAEAGGWMAGSEVALLSLAAPVVVYEQAVRFLADHLAGDVYFRITRPGQNLDRCRAQIRLLSSMMGDMDALERVVAEAWAGT
jgi:hypothetical protein